MTIQRLLLFLYPRVWRARYEEEFLVVLNSQPFSLLEGLDVIRGALDAHLHPCLGTSALSLSERMREMFSTLRSSLLAVFCAYVGFILAGVGFQKMAEDGTFRQAGQAISLVGLSFQLVVIGALVALLALLVGGLPIAVAVIRSAFARKRRGTLFLLTVPFLAFAVFFLTTQLLRTLDHPGVQADGQIFLDRSLFLGSLIVGAAASAGALCRAVVRSEIPERLLRFALLPSILLTLSMALMLAAILVWGLGLRAGAPQLFVGNDGLVGTSTTGTWLGIVIVMSIATGLAIFSLLRGLSARSTLRRAVA